jgi:Putative Ig domain
MSPLVEVSSAADTGADNVSALPNWVLVCLLILVAGVIVGMFTLTLYNLSAPRSTLKNILGLKGHGVLRRRNAAERPLEKLQADPTMLSVKLLENLSKAARVGKRTTRTTLAITGFSLLAILLVAVFALSGQGVRDLRSQVVASLTTLAAAIAGFYFGSESNSGSGATDQSTTTPKPPTLEGAGDGSGPEFVVGEAGSYTPVLSGTPAPIVTLTSGALPPGLALDSTTGVIAGTPAPASAATYPVTLTASNGQPPDASLILSIIVAATAD